MLTKQQLYELKEEQLTNEVLMPLLRAMGYKDVLKHHGGPGELGKDIVCWIEDELGYRVNIAVVGKAVPITGTNAIATEVASQIMQSFGASFRDKGTGEEHYVGKCYVITNKEITKDARPAIQSIVNNLTRSVLANIRYIDGDELWEWYQTHLAEQPLWQRLAEVNRELDAADSHYRLEARLTRSGTEVTAVEKYPGAAADKPIKVKFTTSIPTDTDEGQELAEKIEQFISSGVPVKVPIAYVTNLEFPEFIGQALPEFSKDGFLLMGPAHNPTPLLIRLEFTHNDGEQFTLEYVYLKVVQAGKEEITLTNDEQPLPIKVRLILRTNGSFETEFEFTDTQQVHQLLMQLRFQNFLSQPNTVRIVNLETGLPLASGTYAAGITEAPPAWRLQTLEALDALQIKARKPITFPERELTEEEAHMLEYLRRVFHEGKVEATLNGFSSSVRPVTAEDRTELMQQLEPFAAGKAADLSLFWDETVNLFDIDIPLGKTKPVYVTVRLANEQEVREKLAEQIDGEIQLKFVPSGDKTILKEFLEWPQVKEGTVQ